MHNRFFALLFVLTCFMIPLAAAVSKCYDGEMEEKVCKAPNIEFCLKLECEKGIFRGCGRGNTDGFEQNGASEFCAQFGLGTVKPGGVNTCTSDLCNGDSGNGKGPFGGTGRTSNNAIVIIAIGAIVAMLLTKAQAGWII